VYVVISVLGEFGGFAVISEGAVMFFVHFREISV